MKRIVVRLFASVALVYIILLALMFTFQRNLMYFPRGAVPDELVQRVLPQGERITVETSDGVQLSAYMVPPRDTAQPILLAFHGNGALGTDLIGQFNPLMDKGYGVLFAEYRGYAGNKGRPTETGLYNDADAYLEFLQGKFSANKIIGYGQSLGSGVAIDLVSRHPERFAGLILEVPFDSLVNVVGHIYPFVPFKNILVRDKFLSDEKISSITIPKLFLIAGQDQVVGTESGLRLYTLAPQPKQIEIFPQSGHMDVFYAGAHDAVKNFIDKDIQHENTAIHHP